MWTLLLQFLLALPDLGMTMPQDLVPADVLDAEYMMRFPTFLGHGPGSGVQGSSALLDVQLLLKLDHSLIVAARDHIYFLDTNVGKDEELLFTKRITWVATDEERKTCSMKGRDEMSTLQRTGHAISGIAKCPYDHRQSSVALFAGEQLFSATVTDILAIDSVVYRSLGEMTLRSLKHDSRWFNEPHFVAGIEYKDHVYFFFREISMELAAFGKVVISRVARVCKNDQGGSQRVLERHWTSFQKLRLNCSASGRHGQPSFQFNELQDVAGPVHIEGRDLIVGVFTTPPNSVAGSAVCAFDMADVIDAFHGRFQRQKSSDSLWTPVPNGAVPFPRPGVCAGMGDASEFSSSKKFPDISLTFAKSHPLLSGGVPALSNSPWLTVTQTRSRSVLVAVDANAGPHGNHTVVFIVSNSGHVTKFRPPLPLFSSNMVLQQRKPRGSLVLEELDAYNAPRCSGHGNQKPQSLWLDSPSHSLWVAFGSCVRRLPLSHCHRHSTCKGACLASRDPNCGWQGGTCCLLTPGSWKHFEQDLELDTAPSWQGCSGRSQGSRSAGRWGSGAVLDSHSIALLAGCGLAGFLLGLLSAVACICAKQRRHCSTKPTFPLRLPSVQERQGSTRLPVPLIVSVGRTIGPDISVGLPTPATTPVLTPRRPAVQPPPTPTDNARRGRPPLLFVSPHAPAAQCVPYALASSLCGGENQEQVSSSRPLSPPTSFFDSSPALQMSGSHRAWTPQFSPTLHRNPPPLPHSPPPIPRSPAWTLRSRRGPLRVRPLMDGEEDRLDKETNEAETCSGTVQGGNNCSRSETFQGKGEENENGRQLSCDIPTDFSPEMSHDSSSPFSPELPVIETRTAGGSTRSS
uniref:Semaphorin 6C n=1 Tax=Eptatretus burgeri TaxID=7764 RepID=A0A8C4QXT4_EPTBU